MEGSLSEALMLGAIAMVFAWQTYFYATELWKWVRKW